MATKPARKCGCNPLIPFREIQELAGPGIYKLPQHERFGFVAADSPLPHHVFGYDSMKLARPRPMETKAEELFESFLTANNLMFEKE